MGGAVRRAQLPPPPPPANRIKPAELAPYFWFAGLVHAIAVASRFDVLAAKLPAAAPLAIMLAQVPLLYLSGYFEGRLEYERASGPLWMRIDSAAVKVAFAFGTMYLVVLIAQTWNFSIGPVDPTPPKSFPIWQRAMWFGIFTGGFFFLFYLAAAGVVIPVLRVLTWPLRLLPVWLGAVLALVAGGALGIVVLAAVQSTKIATFAAAAQKAVKASPGLMAAVITGMIVVPMILGLVVRKQE